MSSTKFIGFLKTKNVSLAENNSVFNTWVLGLLFIIFSPNLQAEVLTCRKAPSEMDRKLRLNTHVNYAYPQHDSAMDSQIIERSSLVLEMIQTNFEMLAEVGYFQVPRQLFVEINQFSQTVSPLIRGVKLPYLNSVKRDPRLASRDPIVVRNQSRVRNYEQGLRMENDVSSAVGTNVFWETLAKHIPKIGEKYSLELSRERLNRDIAMNSLALSKLPDGELRLALRERVKAQEKLLFDLNKSLSSVEPMTRLLLRYSRIFEDLVKISYFSQSVPLSNLVRRSKFFVEAKKIRHTSFRSPNPEEFKLIGARQYINQVLGSVKSSSENHLALTEIVMRAIVGEVKNLIQSSHPERLADDILSKRLIDRIKKEIDKLS